MKSELDRRAAPILFISVFVIAASGLAYELVAGALSSYLLGNSTLQFSLVIGLFLTAMGLGSFISRYVRRDLIGKFLAVEVAVGLVGGLSPLALFVAFATTDAYSLLLVLVCVTVGTLVGLEIPLLVRIVRERYSLRSALGNVLSIDYLGALAAALLFPFVLVPNLGLVRSGAFFGLFNLGVAIAGSVLLHQSRRLRAAALISLLVVGAVFITGADTTRAIEDSLYEDEIIYARTTPYQRLVVTRWRGDIRLFIDGNIQFASSDEFRYHEALVHPAMGSVARAERVLVLGGGDGMAVREILRYPEIQRVVLVDLDPAMTEMFRDIDLLRQLNGDSLRDPRVEIINRDAFTFLESSDELFDVVVIDLPDPNHDALAKLYSRSFYRLVVQHLRQGGVFVTQATSPYYSTQAFWCIANTIAATDRASGASAVRALPYHTLVPSFGDWGFVLGGERPLAPERIRLRVETRFLTQELLPTLFAFGKDTARRNTPVNRLDDPILLDLYRSGFDRFNM